MANHNFLPSDDQNPDFTGAHNPDQRLTARFFVQALQNNFKSEQEGRPIFDDVHMVRIDVPGDQLNVVVAPVREDHKRRFPLQWAHFSNQMDGDQRLAGKTPINMWPRLTPAQVAELQHMKFLAVEDIAGASDSALQTIGMIGGMSPFAFREAAQRFLFLAKADADSNKENAAMTELQAKYDAQENRMAAMQAMLDKLASAQPANGDNFAALAAATTEAVPDPFVTPSRKGAAK